MKTRAIPVHAVEVFYYRHSAREVTATVWAPIAKLLSDKLRILFTVNLDGPLLAYPPTQLVKAHAYQLVRHV